MKYIGEKGRQQKSDFQKKSNKKKKDKLSVFLEHLKKEKHQLHWSSIKILARENKSKEAYFIAKHNAPPFKVSGKRLYSFIDISNSGKRSFLKFRRI